MEPFSFKLIHGCNTVNLRDIYRNLSMLVYGNNDHIDLSIFNDSQSLIKAIGKLYNHALFNLRISEKELSYYFY